MIKVGEISNSREKGRHHGIYVTIFYCNKREKEK
jgi:hypothetical protein